jgi:hypothetical protein
VSPDRELKNHAQEAVTREHDELPETASDREDVQEVVEYTAKTDGITVVESEPAVFSGAVKYRPVVLCLSMIVSLGILIGAMVAFSVLFFGLAPDASSPAVSRVVPSTAEPLLP